MSGYVKESDASHHRDPVILVACSAGYNVSGKGAVMYARGNEDKLVVVKGAPYWSSGEGKCYAMTAIYTGWGPFCREMVRGGCRFGAGNQVALMTFEKTGQYTELTAQQYQQMKHYARNSEYPVFETHPDAKPNNAAYAGCNCDTGAHQYTETDQHADSYYRIANQHTTAKVELAGIRALVSRQCLGIESRGGDARYPTQR